MPEITTNINKTLTRDEIELFDLLQKVVDQKAQSTTLRVAGGWVRDHMLGVPSDDIDIMVDNMSGETFAKMVTGYIGAKNPHTIRENPDKSKHIETAKTYIPLSSGKVQEIDFARARKEVYHGDSRIPSITPATAQEDAMRRDLTINALFYNLKTRNIEDFTGKGISDLLTNTIRTPINPLQTFKDDPLRIFRVIRFAAKYNGKIDPETYSALQNPELKTEIRQKISKERIGTEINKMLKNPNPLQAITLLKETGLLSDILEEALKGTKYEGKMSQLDMNQDNPNHKLSLWEHTFQVLTHTLDKYREADDEKRVTAILGALAHDLGKLFQDIQTKREGTDKHPGHEKGFTSYVGHEEESFEIIQHILRYLKLDPYIQQVAGLARYHMQPHSLVRDSGGEKALRKFIRRMGELSLNWLDVFNLALADAYSKDKNIDPKTVQEYSELQKRLELAIASLSMEATQQKVQPILDGNEIMQILGIKPGVHMKEISEFVKELKDENPNITKEEAASQLTSWWNNKQNPEVPSKTASVQASVCPRQLFRNRFYKINELMDEERDYEAISVLNQLRKEYQDDDAIARLAAISIFKAIIKDPKLRDNDLLQFVFSKAENNFLDPIIGAYTTGILMMIKSGTDPEVINELGSRIAKLSPGTLKSVLESIPKDRIVDAKMFQEISSLTRIS